MWINVRSMDGKKSVRIDGLSKLTKIEDLRPRLIEEFDAPSERQRLFYRGKQLEDGHSLFDYNVGLNDIIQILLRPDLSQVQKNGQKKTDDNESETPSEDESIGSNKENKETFTVKNEPEAGSSQEVKSQYLINEIIDARDPITYAWFEAVIVGIRPSNETLTIGKVSESTSVNITKDNGNNIDDKNEAHLLDGFHKNKECKTEKLNEVNHKVTDHNKEQDSEVDIEKKKTSDDSDSDEDIDENDSKQKNSRLIEKLLINGFDHELDSKKSADCSNCTSEEYNDGFIYTVIYDGYPNEPSDLQFKDIRPRSRTTISFEDLKINSTVMVNYNYDEPSERGYWYDVKITKLKNSRTNKELYCTLFLGTNGTLLENCKILFVNEVFKIEKQGKCERLFNNPDNGNPSTTPVRRQNKPECTQCKDNPKIKCKNCACHQCGGKSQPEKQILCDECDCAYHIWCLTPPMETIPNDEEWYCPECKNDDSEVVKAGEKLKESKKKSKMASANSNCRRDWGKGMACVGRTKECTIVPPNHFGPIPGIEVGTLWKFRVQVSEAGVHRPHVAGIHGRETEGAYSIVLSGGYEDDKDDGDEFRYTGSGGRDLSGNKRTAEQSCDQALTRMNRALALNCNAPINNNEGAEAKDWQKGKPVRVVRNCKGRKHSKYAPEEGNRYDGIYKIVKYWPERGKSGFLVWRFLLKRDDPTPSPWSKAGKKRTKVLGLTIQYPEGYLDAQKDSPDNTPTKGCKKRKVSAGDTPDKESPSNKKTKIIKYHIPENIKKLINEDRENKKLWDECLESVSEGSQEFLNKVEQTFLCICCQEIVCRPITTKCNHNVCQDCLTRSFKAEVYTCPACRSELGKNYSLAINKKLNEIMLGFYPGYAKNR